MSSDVSPRHRAMRIAFENFELCLIGGSVEEIADAAHRLYEAFGTPFGRHDEAPVIWLAHKTWTTAN